MLRSENTWIPALQGLFLDFVRHVPLAFDRTPFHDALHSFAQGQLANMQTAISGFALAGALTSAQNLQELSLVFLTKFVLYKQELSGVLLQEPAKSSWERLVQLQEQKFGGNLASSGAHFAVLNVLPQVLAGDVQAPEAEDIKKAYRKMSFQFHSDKSAQIQVDRRKRRSISASEAQQMMVKINEAKEFLFSEPKVKGFCNSVHAIFVDDMKPLKEASYIETLLIEQRYGALSKLLDDVNHVDKKLASSFDIPVARIVGSIKEKLCEQVRKTKESAQAKWSQVSTYPELHEELSKLKNISRELAAYPDIVPEFLIKEISGQVEAEIKKHGAEAQRYVNLASLSQAKQNLRPFGACLISLGHIFTHLGDFKDKAELEVESSKHGHLRFESGYSWCLE